MVVKSAMVAVLIYAEPSNEAAPSILPLTVKATAKVKPTATIKGCPQYPPLHAVRQY